MKRVFLGCDHAGVAVRAAIVKLIESLGGHEVVDLGTVGDQSVDYPEFAVRVARRVAAGEGLGILVCGSGIGMSIAANKIAGVRAAVVWDVTTARLSRLHNDANVLCLGSRLLGPEVMVEAVRTWLTTVFEGGRHERRVAMLRQLDQERPK